MVLQVREPLLVVDLGGKIIYRLRRVTHTLLLLGNLFLVHQQIAIFVALLLSKGVQQLLGIHRELIQVLEGATGDLPAGQVVLELAMLVVAQVGTLVMAAMVAVGLAEVLLTVLLALAVVVAEVVLRLQLVQAQGAVRVVVA
jgi:hypothetical protein